MRRVLQRMMFFVIGLLLLLVLSTIVYMTHARFGANATGERLAKMEAKTNYVDGAFDNVEYTPALAEGTSYGDMLYGFFFSSKKRNVPKDLIPVEKNNLRQMNKNLDQYVWFGHSSYLLQLNGKTILVDPVFSLYASPVRVGVKAFKSEYTYTADDMPDIDILVITHDHWDHLDYNTFMAIKGRVKRIVTGLGVGAHLEKWGYSADQITELYWGESAEVLGFEFTSVTSRHFSGRTFKRNVTLWSSFVLQSEHQRIYLGGDSGYGKHFAEIGAQYGPFDFAILENGQYNQMWKYIHMMPEEVITASQDLKTNLTFPVHSSKFPLANHAWDEPLIRVTEAARKENFNVLIPKIGQIIQLDSLPTMVEWWKGVE